mgnify:CR=1 FL=1
MLKILEYLYHYQEEDPVVIKGKIVESFIHQYSSEWDEAYLKPLVPSFYSKFETEEEFIEAIQATGFIKFVDSVSSLDIKPLHELCCAYIAMYIRRINIKKVAKENNIDYDSDGEKEPDTTDKSKKATDDDDDDDDDEDE